MSGMKIDFPLNPVALVFPKHLLIVMRRRRISFYAQEIELFDFIRIGYCECDWLFSTF